MSDHWNVDHKKYGKGSEAKIEWVFAVDCERTRAYVEELVAVSKKHGLTIDYGDNGLVVTTVKDDFSTIKLAECELKNGELQ